MARRAELAPELKALRCEDHEALRSWLAKNDAVLSTVPNRLLERADVTRNYFACDGVHRRDGEKQRRALDIVMRNLEGLAMSGPAALVHDAVHEWPDYDLQAVSRAMRAFRAPPSFLAGINILAAFKRRTARLVLEARGLGIDRQSCLSHAEVANFELMVRRSAQRLRELSTAFALDTEPLPADRQQLLVVAKKLAHDLDTLKDMAKRIDACPVQDLWPHFSNLTSKCSAGGESLPLAPLLHALYCEMDASATLAQSLAALRKLTHYLSEDASLPIKRSIEQDAPFPFDRKALLAALPHLVAFQTYRLRRAQISAPGSAVFEEFEPLAAELLKMALPVARDCLADLMRREAASAWKDEIEVRRPILRQLRTELEEQIAKLDKLDHAMREANRQLLAHVKRSQVKGTQDWSRIWAITGANAQRLRQVFGKGRSLGLLKLRPIWLVNPDVVSRMLPLEPGLFDVVIFDEASQMRVVNALPSLYRARRCIVSGDEKQLPPTSFFGARLDIGDNGSDDDPDDSWREASAEDAEDAEAELNHINPRELAASERHIKDCEDLLAMSRGVLPEACLDIHYRSEYRELIAFSNAAYCGGRLNVPVRRPLSEVQRARPIEVRRVDGLYSGQTNPQEAATIVDILAELWTSTNDPPTVGVVTFNLKQAELIERRLIERADVDRVFSHFLDRERTRTAQGEDVGFFVKNLENVQGDERDWVIFSTTFGRDEAGVFKRVFGALNQQGGERRLNVAVTRAKLKIILVTSIPTSEISGFIGQRRPPVMARDYLQAYMRYAELINDGEFEAAARILGVLDGTPRLGNSSENAEPDDLVLQALEALRAEGFSASLMPLQDAFSLDIAITNPKTNLYALGVEFDSSRHRLLRHARAREVWRPKLLERSGLHLHRIPSAAWVQDQAKESARLIAAARHAISETRT